MASSDPYYNRKPVPSEFLEHVGPTGLTRDQELLNRERKLSTDQGDLRRFSNPKTKSGRLDPHYARKPVPDELIKDVGRTGLTPEQEYLNREKKMMVDGVDLRRFSTSKTGGMAPQDDPYYGRKKVDNVEIIGVGETGMSKAEDFEVRDRKQSVFDLSSDPFQQISGAGHRQSVSGPAVAGAADARRRSSAVAPDAARATANAGHGHHSGYQGETLAPIQSRTDGAPATETVGSASMNQYEYGTSTGTGTGTTTTNNGVSSGEHGLYHDIATNDPDSVAPNEVR